ncbi:MAG: lipopolysaccharide biosynthesis protein [Thermoplasmatota archaeon]
MSGDEHAKGLRDALVFAPGRVLPNLTQFLLLYLAAHLLPLEELGWLALLLTLATMASLVLGGWIDQANLRYYPEQYARDGGTGFLARNRHLLGWASLVAALVLVGLVAVAWARQPARLPGLALCGALVLVLVWYNNSQFLLVCQRKPLAYSSAEAVRFTLCTLLAVAVALAGHASPEAFLLAFTVATGCALLPSLSWSSSLRFPTVRDRAHIRMVLAFGLPTLVWLAGAQGLVLLDRLLVGLRLGDAAIGVFQLNANLLPLLPLLAAMPLIYSAHASVMARASAPAQEIEDLVRRFHATFLFTYVPIGTVVSWVGRDVTALLYGPEVASAWAVVPLLVAANLLWQSSFYAQKRLELEARTRVMAGLVLVALGLSAASTWVLLPRVGIPAAGVGALVGFGSYLAMVSLVPGTRVRWRVHWKAGAQSLAASGVSLAFAAAVASWAKPAGLAKVAVVGVLFAVAYAGLLWMLLRSARKAASAP